MLPALTQHKVTAMERWMVEVTYLDGSTPQVFGVEELHELHNHIERGRDWRDIDKITVQYRLTVKAKRAA